MSYATLADLEARLGEPRLRQLTDITIPATGGVDESVAQSALDDATAEIDGYLAGRYALPLAEPPAILRVYCLAIAHYRLMGSTAGDVERADYAAAIKYLAQVATGTIALYQPGIAPAQQGAGSVLFAPGAKVSGSTTSVPTEFARRFPLAATRTRRPSPRRRPLWSKQ